MEWTVMIEGRDELGEVQQAQLRTEKVFERLKSGEIGLSIEDGKRIMTMLQELVVKQELAAYALARRVCPECARFRPQRLHDAENPNAAFQGTCMALAASPGHPRPIT